MNVGLVTKDDISIPSSGRSSSTATKDLMSEKDNEIKRWSNLPKRFEFGFLNNHGLGWVG